MKQFKNILLAAETDLDADPVIQRAVEIAQCAGASLTIVDVVPDFPWTVRLTMKDHSHVHDLIRQERAEQLNAIAAPIAAQGINVATKVLLGKASIELVREVLRGSHDLLICHTKSGSNATPSYFGETATRLLRKCPCPLMLVNPECDSCFQHVAGCVDTSTGTETDAELNDKVFHLASALSEQHQCRLSIVHAWAFWNEQMLKGRINEETFEAMEGKMEVQIAKLLDDFLAKHGRHADDPIVHMVKGEPSVAIAEFAEREHVDLMVLGTVARTGLSGVIMGNTAERILSQLKCSVLAIKPESFRCPVHI